MATRNTMMCIGLRGYEDDMQIKREVELNHINVRSTQSSLCSQPLNSGHRSQKTRTKTKSTLPVSGLINLGIKRTLADEDNSMMVKTNMKKCRRNQLQEPSTVSHTIFKGLMRRNTQMRLRWRLVSTPLRSMKLITLNFRGFGNPQELHPLKDLVTKEDPNILFLQETKLASRHMNKFKFQLLKFQ